MSNILGNMPPVFGSGYRGVVPAPTAADVSAQNILRADGVWAAGPSGTLPSQTGNAGKLLTTDGTNASWSSTLGGNLTVSGTGAFSGAVSTLVSTNAENRLSNRNTFAGASAYASFLLGNDVAPNLGALYALSSGYTTSAQYVADTLVIESSRPAGMGISTTNGGPIKFWHSGVNTATFTSSATTIAGNLTVSGGTTTITGSAPALALKRSSDNSFVGYIDATTTGTLRLFSGVGGSNALAASFLQNGNLLIGTTTDGGQKLQVNGTAAISGGIVGTTTNDNAAAGIVGEYVSSTVGAGSAITLTTATAANLTSITLTPGDWDVVFVPHFWGAGGSVTGTQCVSSLSTTSATLDTTPDRLAQFPSVPTSSADLTVAIPATRFSVTSSTIIYGVVRSTFTVGTNKVYGVLSARRVR